MCMYSTTLDFTSDHDHKGNHHNLNHLHVELRLCRPGQALPTPGWVSLDSGSPAPAPVQHRGDQLVQAGSYNTSVIRLGKWRHLTRLQLRLKPHGPVCKLHCSHKQSHWNKATQKGLLESAALIQQLLSLVCVCVFDHRRQEQLLIKFDIKYATALNTAS